MVLQLIKVYYYLVNSIILNAADFHKQPYIKYIFFSKNLLIQLIQ